MPPQEKKWGRSGQRQMAGGGQFAGRAREDRDAQSGVSVWQSGMPAWTEELQEEKKPEGLWGQSLVGPWVWAVPAPSQTTEPGPHGTLVQWTLESCFHERNN